MVPARPKPAFRASVLAQSVRSVLKAVWWTAAGSAARVMIAPKAEPVATDRPKPALATVRRAYLEAFAKDARDIAAGLYPALHDRATAPGKALAQTADFLQDARQVEARRRRGGGTEARDLASSAAYPAYYKQNFHFQSGGWFTPDSARRYDAQVEALFSGAAGAMRRRVLSVLMRGLMGQDQRGLKVVDLACGTGGFLRDLVASLPRAQISGLDLSPAYVQQARMVAGTAVVQANMERLPYSDASLDAVTCIYLFHELPPRLRPLIAREMARVLKPGGLLGFGDSIQPQDAPDLARLLDVFPAFFHEPYYDSYAQTDLIALFEGEGLELRLADQAFLTKALLFRKPA
jgi:ubiquinone/menaquinone biosynthesis C-methylase UbiE